MRRAVSRYYSRKFGIQRALAVRLLLGAGLLGVASPGFSAGLEIPQKGIREMGIAYGGSAALLEDASAVANNPAGMTRLEGRQVLLGATLLRPEFRYDTEVRRELIDNPQGEPTVSGDGAGRIDDLAVAPHLYYVQVLSDTTAVGLGIYGSFGSATDYGDHWAGRYHASSTEITAININPTFAWQATERLSFGAGIVIQYFEANLQNQVDVGYVVADEVIRELREEQGEEVNEEETAEIVAILAENHDVSNEIDVDSWAYGFNAGVLYEVDENTRFGLNYQSRTRHLSKGDAKRPELDDPQFEEDLAVDIEEAIRVVVSDGEQLLDGFLGLIGQGQIDAAAEEGAAQAVGPNGAMGGRVATQINLPQTVTLSFYHRLFTSDFAVTGGATWTEWSDLEEIRFSYTDASDRGGADITGSGDDVRRRDLVQPFAWRDTWRYGLGVIYDGFSDWTLRAGVSLDESPIPDAQRRTPRGPDSDRTIGALGLSWEPGDQLFVDMAYTYTRFRNSRINTRENPAGTRHRIVGSYRGSLQSLGVQLGYRF